MYTCIDFHHKPISLFIFQPLQDDHDAVYEGAVGSPRGQAGGEAFNRNIPVKKVSPDECIPAIMTLFNEAKVRLEIQEHYHCCVLVVCI